MAIETKPRREEIAGLDSELEYGIGDMLSESGNPAYIEIIALAEELTHSIADRVCNTSVYRDLERSFPSERLDVFFKFRIRSEIIPFVKELVMVRWHLKHKPDLVREPAVVFVPRNLLMQLLADEWPDSVVVLESKSDVRAFLRKLKWLRWLRDLGRLAKYYLVSLKDGKSDKTGPSQFTADVYSSTIAVHYMDGIDQSRRSDIAWFPESEIRAEKILMYFDTIDLTTLKPVSEGTLAVVEKTGFKWLTLRPGITARWAETYWKPTNREIGLEGSSLSFGEAMGGDDLAEYWAADVARELAYQVGYWGAFQRKHRVRVQVVTEEGYIGNIAQSIAIEADKYGILVGKQRSELALTDIYGFFPHDVHFVWNKRAAVHIKKTHSKTRNAIVVGHLHDRTFRDAEKVGGKLRAELEDSGAHFVLALFDNTHSYDTRISPRMVEAFYRKFLNWLLEDDSLGLLIKSKKSKVIGTLPQIHTLFSEAEKTGRCIRLTNEFSRLPTEAATGADIAVGVSISTPIIESALAGCRGIHWDALGLLRSRESAEASHEFYQWGFESIIFEDIDRLIGALKIFKSKRDTSSSLGDWTPFLDELDPFRDGKAGERMGSYIRWCTEGFDAGLDREQVMQKANALYAERWGADKVYELEAG
jgi:hypothetical protein